MQDMEKTTKQIVAHALEAGATLAGLCSARDLADSPSYRAVPGVHPPYTEGALIVLALRHPPTSPELDWWCGPGGTEGNRLLMSMCERMCERIQADMDLACTQLPYHPERGGVFLKDAAVYAGMGVIGRNNLVVTRDYGPDVRLRAVHVPLDLPSTGIPDFAPCEDCYAPCQEACPQRAFSEGVYARDACARQMTADEASRAPHPRNPLGKDKPCIRYCRDCEQHCSLSEAT
ncbi:MAG: hypothetical protein ACLFOY_06890 [Desulfatibacillaceae bacterium]